MNISSLRPLGLGTSHSRCKRAENQQTIALNCTFSDERAAEMAQIIINHPCSNAIFIFLKYMVSFAHGCSIVAPSIETIAKKCNLSDRHISRVIKILREMGIIQWVRRPYNSNVYKFSPVLEHSKFRQAMAPHVKLFAYLCFSLLLPFKKISAEEYNRRELVVKTERFHSQSDFTGSSPSNIVSNISSSKVSTLSLYIPPDKTDLRRPEPQRVADSMSQSLEIIRAREGSVLSKVANRVGMLLNLEGEDRQQLGQYSDEELLYAEEALRNCAFEIRDRVKWVHAVCRNYREGKGKRKPSNFNGGQRYGQGQYNRSAPQRNEPVRQIQPLIQKDYYTTIQQCSKDDPGATFYERTKVWVREVEIPLRREHTGPVEPVTYESLQTAFERRPNSSPIFSMLKEMVLNRARKGEGLDLTVFSDDPVLVEDTKVPTSDNTLSRLQEITNILRGGAQR